MFDGAWQTSGGCSRLEAEVNMSTKRKKRLVVYLPETDYEQLALRARAEGQERSPFAATIIAQRVRAGAANQGLEGLLPEVKASIQHAVNAAVFGLRKLLVFSGLQAHVGTTMTSHILALLNVSEEETNEIREEAERIAGKHLRQTNRELERLLAGFEDADGKDDV
jgi:vacuolar-type H+-ATPase subunit E/Vma4